MHDDLIAAEIKLQNWLENAGAHGGRREEAVERIRTWAGNMANGGDLLPLDLSGLDLNELPPYLPKELRNLHVRDNRLAKIPPLNTLPVDLRTLDARGNPVRELPADSVAGTRRNLFMQIDGDFLSDDIKSRHLRQSSGPMYAFTAAKHKWLEEWAGSGPENETAARQTARGLINTYVLARQPGRTLNLSGLGLTSIPPGLPAWIRKLNFQNNRLRDIPPIASLPPDVALDLSGNPITGLPADLMTTGLGVRIEMDPDSLPIETRIALEARFDEEDYVGPQIKYPPGVSRNLTATQLANAVKSWADEAGQPLKDWTEFRLEESANRFATFLDRLREVSLYRHPASPQALDNFRLRVANLLKQLQDDPELRSPCFGLAQNAIDNCGDRVAMRMLDMETLCLDKRFADAIRRGHYDNNPGAVLDYCRGQYRRKIIEDAAYRKIETLKIDAQQVEVFLSFFTRFAAKYQLPVQMNSMLSDNCGITGQEFAELERKLSNAGVTRAERDANNHSFQKFLATSSAMNLLLERSQSPERIQALQHRIEEEKGLRQATLYAELEKLTDGDSTMAPGGLDTAIQTLQSNFLRIDLQVQEELKKDLVKEFLRENRLAANLGD